MLTRLQTLIQTSHSVGGVAPVIGEWGLAGDSKPSFPLRTVPRDTGPTRGSVIVAEPKAAVSGPGFCTTRDLTTKPPLFAQRLRAIVSVLLSGTPGQATVLLLSACNVCFRCVHPATQ